MKLDHSLITVGKVVPKPAVRERKTGHSSHCEEQVGYTWFHAATSQ